MTPITILRVIVSLCAAASFVLSFRLWITARDYPHVPVVSWLPQPPALFAVALFGLMLISLLVIAAGRFLRVAAFTALGIMLVWVVLDQNRWQPYLVFYAVAILCFLLAGEEREPRSAAMAPLKLLVCCTYIYSGLHKFNYSYLGSGLRWFVEPLLDRAGVEAPGRIMAAAGALSIAIFELGMGLMLLSVRTRRFAIIGLTAMHLFILLALSPIGRNYNSVVWPWNVASIAVLWLLFHAESRERSLWLDGASVATRHSWRAVLILCGILPALNFAGWWFSSLSFQLYARKQPSAVVRISPGYRRHLPPSAARILESDGSVNLFQWGMSDTNATPNMERHVVLAAARQLAITTRDPAFRLTYASTPSLFRRGRWVRYYEFEGPERQATEITAVYQTSRPKRNSFAPLPD